MSGLVNATVYYWHVGAKNAGGVSGWSSTWSFTTVVAAPGIPGLAAPANDSMNAPTSLTLSWNTAPGAVSYAVQVSTDAAFGTTVFGQGGITGGVTAEAVSGLANATVYYWHVGAKDAGGVSGWSATWSFTTVSATSVIAQNHARMLTTDCVFRNGAIVYSLAKASPVELSFSDMLGRAAMKISRTQEQGSYSLTLQNSSLASGRYIVRFKADGINKRFVVMVAR